MAANSEQIKAIEHHGGVLLKAGAGSGKTFVLKEHLIFLASEWIKDFKSRGLSLDEVSVDSKKRFKRIVMMTFTKKAAGELNIRIHQEFREQILTDASNSDYWRVLNENLAYLNVSTIHGFCFKLIRMGAFPRVSSDQNIISQTEFEQKVENIYENVLLTVTKQARPQLTNLILKNKNNVFDSIKAIFSDPTLRNMWMELNIERLDTQGLVAQLFEEVGINNLIKNYPTQTQLDEYTGTKWCDFLISFKASIDLDYESKNCGESFFSELNELSFKIPVKPSLKKVSPEIVSFYEQFRDIKDYLKKNSDHLLEFKKSKDGELKEWLRFIYQLVHLVDEAYNKEEGVTFSDLEYIVYKNLQNSEIADTIAKEFDYFIIDEFQDTSYIQFSIVEKIIQENYLKLFCVGDLKQAIYGFRGGELGVFLACEKKIPLNLSLKNNYRSDQEVIKFNNHLFDFLFKRGDKYEGEDQHAVAVEHQTAPIIDRKDGEVRRLVVDIDFLAEDEKVSNLSTDYIEALAIFHDIKKSRLNASSAVLYKRLRPSLILMNLLMESKVGFTAQVKIPFLEDPIIGLFYTLIENEFNKNINNQDYLELMLRSYLNILGHPDAQVITEKVITSFKEDTVAIGLYQAFLNTMHSCGLRNSNYKNNLLYISELILSHAGETKDLLRTIRKQTSNAYSLDFCYGENSQNIKLMTAHASKGLQFTNVYLAGMYTNENIVRFSSLIGKLPYSFKWTNNLFDKKTFKTPTYLLEEILTKKKEFSESKRLFYVASTRAEESISWVHINWGDLKRSKAQSNSWIAGLNIWEDESSLKLNIQDITYNLEQYYSQELEDRLSYSPPFFHLDNLGNKVIESTEECSFLPELSVTKLAIVEQCPRKFYLSNICKISEDELNILDSSDQYFPVEADNELSSFSFGSSSAQRGSEIHESISHSIINELKVEASGKDKKQIHWAVDNLRKYKDNFELISEKPIKFEFFGYMISGIPDLLILPGKVKQGFEVWDFKTGKHSEDKAKPYVFQLMTYAYACYNLGYVTQDQPCRLVLCYVDEENLVEQNIQYKDVENYFSERLSKLNSYHISAGDHCDFCDYKNICKRDT